MTSLEYRPTNDLVYKTLMQENKGLLVSLVAALLNVKPDKLEALEILDREVAPKHIADKTIRLDIRVKVGSKQIDIEVQTADSKREFKEYALYYGSLIYSSSAASGESYRDALETIIVCILDFKLFSSPEFYSEFRLLEIKRKEELCGKLSFKFFELTKLKDTDAINETLALWLKFFSAKTEEDLSHLKRLNNPVIVEAVDKMTTITSDMDMKVRAQRIRMAEAERLADLQIWREEGLAEGEAKGKAEGQSELLHSMHKRGYTAAQIADITGLELFDVERLMQD